MTPPSRRALVDRLRGVLDPELGWDVVALGLIYGLDVAPDGTVEARVTMTTPVCPMTPYLVRQIARTLAATPGVRQARVELVHDPPWSPAMVDPQLRALLGPPRRRPLRASAPDRPQEP